jgi:hypothetical protein
VSCGLASGNALGFAVDMVLVLVIFVRTKGSLPLMETGLARPLDEKKFQKFENLHHKCNSLPGSVDKQLFTLGLLP